MRDVLLLAIHLMVTLVKLTRPGGVRSVIAESLLLKHQLIICGRTRRRAPPSTTLDRSLLGLTTMLVHPRQVEKLAAILKPATLLRFHKALVDRKYRRLFSSAGTRRKPGPKGPTEEIAAVILQIKLRNPRFGNQRIAQQISHAFGLQIDKDVVRRVLARHYGPEHPHAPGPSWLTFIAQAKDSLWSVDLFRCESILLRSHWVLVVMDVFTRRIIGFGIGGQHIDGPAVCRMFNRVISGQALPARISTDHDPLFRFHRWLANLRVLEIEEIKSVPYAPMSHPFVERLIGTIRRAYLDHPFFWNSIDLHRKLDAFRRYHNGVRVHRSLDGHTPEHRAGHPSSSTANLVAYGWESHCNGLFETPVAARFAIRLPHAGAQLLRAGQGIGGASRHPPLSVRARRFIDTLGGRSAPNQSACSQARVDETSAFCLFRGFHAQFEGTALAGSISPDASSHVCLPRAHTVRLESLQAAIRPIKRSMSNARLAVLAADAGF